MKPRAGATGSLIEGLVQDLRPVRPLPAPPLLASAFLAGALPLVALVALLLRPRQDLALKLDQGWFLAMLALLVAAAIGATLAVATLGLPGRRGFRVEIGVAAALVLAAFGLMLSRTPWVVVPAFGMWFGRGVLCASCVLLLAALPAAIGVWLLRRGAPMRPALAGGLLGMAVGLLSAAALAWVCDWDEPAHVLVSHLLAPVGALAAAGALAGRRWLRW